MSALGDLRNLIRRETSHSGKHERLDIVEFSAKGRNDMGRKDDPSLALRTEEDGEYG